jgi:hypothetical protein
VKVKFQQLWSSMGTQAWPMIGPRSSRGAIMV